MAVLERMPPQLWRSVSPAAMARVRCPAFLVFQLQPHAWTAAAEFLGRCSISLPRQSLLAGMHRSMPRMSHRRQCCLCLSVMVVTVHDLHATSVSLQPRLPSSTGHSCRPPATHDCQLANNAFVNQPNTLLSGRRLPHSHPGHGNSERSVIQHQVVHALA